jgi:hypothetical protein
MKPNLIARKPKRPTVFAARSNSGSRIPFTGLGFGSVGQAYLNALGACQGEACNFLTKRLSADIAYGQDLAKCGDLGQAAAVHQEWARHAVMDYVNEGQVLVGLFNTAFGAGGKHA